jgi:hypothetical protein
LASGYDNGDIERYLGDFGMDRFIRKPYRFGTLKEKLASVLAE